jgi:NhaA family Na+:H+ antiporter
MTDDSQQDAAADEDSEGLGSEVGEPPEKSGVRHRIRRLRSSVPRLSRFAVEHLLLLPLGAGIALIWVNTAPESYYRVTYAIAFAVNDIAMVFFFGLMMKEVAEATAPGGVLHPWRRALVPLIAAIGATAIPALLHVRVVDWLEEPALTVGWPVAFATDIAVAYFFARIIFGLHAAIPFLLLMAIASDALGFVAIVLFHPTEDVHLAGDVHLVAGALLMAGALAVAVALRKARVRSFWPYVLVAGSLSWYALFWGGFHPALALVPIMAFLPHAPRDPGFFVDARPDARDALSQFELVWKYPAQVALFFFGLVNAGVPLRALEQGTWGLPIAVIVGKPIGVLLAAGVAVAVGLHLPQRVGWRELTVVGFIAAIGFSIGLFFTAALLAQGQLRSETGMGVLLTLLAAPLAFLAAQLLRVGRFGR